MDNELKTEIKKWLADFRKTQPKNVEIDNDTFEGGAYFLLSRVLEEDKSGDKEYLIIGSNNFWYACDKSLVSAQRDAKLILAGELDGYADPESGHEPDRPDTMYIYRAQLVKEYEN